MTSVSPESYSATNDNIKGETAVKVVEDTAAITPSESKNGTSQASLLVGGILLFVVGIGIGIGIGYPIWNESSTISTTGAPSTTTSDFNTVNLNVFYKYI